jgi:hypothetical protein
MQEYPKWMYGPKGADGQPQSRIFNKDDQVPKGWEDHPDKVKEPAKKPEKPNGGKKDPVEPGKPEQPEPTPEERAATIKEVREAAQAAGVEIELSDDATVEEINAAIDKLTATQGS